MAAIAPAFASVSAKSGCAARARATKSATAGLSARVAGVSCAEESGSASGRTG